MTECSWAIAETCTMQTRSKTITRLQSLYRALQEVEGHPVVKTKVLHLFRYAECNHLSLTGTTGLHEVTIANCLYWDAHRRDSGVILSASGGAGMELLQIWGHWIKGKS